MGRIDILGPFIYNRNGSQRYSRIFCNSELLKQKLLTIELKYMLGLGKKQMCIDGSPETPSSRHIV